MSHRLTEGLLRRAAQWKAFHEWEQSRRDDLLTFGERVAWYAAAFDFVKNSLRLTSTFDKREKANLVRHVHARLKFLKRNDSDA